MLKIGVTGGIGAGKSVVCRLFGLLHVPVYDADVRAKWLMAHHLGLRNDLIAAYGLESYTRTGELNREYLAKLVFQNQERLAQLNGLVHPRVRDDFASWAEANATAPYVVKEAALMYESEAHRQMDRIVTVFAPLETRIKRTLQRDPYRSLADVQAIISKQLNEEEKLLRADHILYNDDQQLVIPQVLALHTMFSQSGNKV